MFAERKYMVDMGRSSRIREAVVSVLADVTPTTTLSTANCG